jgi:hypothetical protein
MLIQLSSEHLQLNSFSKGKEPVPELVLRFGDKFAAGYCPLLLASILQSLSTVREYLWYKSGYNFLSSATAYPA